MVSIQKFQIIVLVSNRIESNTEVTIRFNSKFRIFRTALTVSCQRVTATSANINLFCQSHRCKSWIISIIGWTYRPLSLSFIGGTGHHPDPLQEVPIGVLGHFDSGDLAMTPIAPARVLGSVTPDVLPSLTASSLITFKTLLKTHLFIQSYYVT